MIFSYCRTNIPKQTMAFLDFPFPDDVPSFPYQPDVLRYLHRYAEHHNLNRFIMFRTLVEKVVPLPHTIDSRDVGCVQAMSAHSCFMDTVKWQITTRNVISGDHMVDEFDLVLVCNG